jgi:hypothetical protein
MKKKKFMAAVYIGLVLWMVAFLQITMTKVFCSENQITQAFARNQLSIMESTIDCRVEMGKQSWDIANLKKMFGKSVTVTYGYANGTRFSHIVMKENADYNKLWSKKKQLDDFCKSKFGSDKYTINASVYGVINKSMNTEEKEKLASTLRKQFGGIRIKTLENERYYVEYAYGPGMGDNCITVDGDNVNLNIAIVSDKESSTTKVYVATPLLTEDY